MTKKFSFDRDRESVITESRPEAVDAFDEVTFYDASVDRSSTSAAVERQFRCRRDQSTLTDLSQSTDLPEIEIVSLISEELPRYKLRAGKIHLKTLNVVNETGWKVF